MTVMMILGRIRIKVSSCDLGVSVYRLFQLQNLLFKICVTVLGPLLWDWGLSGHHWIYLGPFFVLMYKLFNIGQQCKCICKRQKNLSCTAQLWGGCERGEALKWIHTEVHFAWQEDSSWQNYSYAAQWKDPQGKHTCRQIQDTHGHTQLEAAENRGLTVFHETGEWAVGSRPASSYLDGNFLETRTNQSRQVCLL